MPEKAIATAPTSTVRPGRRASVESRTLSFYMRTARPNGPFGLTRFYRILPVQLAYALLVPDDVHNWTRRRSFELVERYGGRLSTVGPHVTIKNGFEAETAAQYENYLDRLAAETEPFELALHGYGFFEAPAWVVFLEVEQRDELRTLHRRVLDDLALEPAQFEGADLHFHATLALDLPPDAHARARTKLTDEPTPRFRFPLERIALARYAEELGIWTTYRIAAVA